MSAQDFGNYQLLKKLATGGMAEVWLARKTGIEGFERLVVIKRILPHLAEDPEFVQMFLNEAKIAARFNHPNIAQIYDLGEVNGTYFIAMEYVHGEDLGRVMRKAWSTGAWIARPLAIRVVASAGEGLSYAHAKADEQGRPLRVVHRDISPQNILISFDGSVKVVDFGIAKAADQASMTKSGAIKGKFAYMSPEQAAGKPLDHRSDIFALGLVLYELLTGIRPLKRDSELGTLQAALECSIEPPSRVADVPRELDSVVMKALAKAADDRYRDARQFQMALEEFLIGQRMVATSVQVSELMTTLFADRLEEEMRSGKPEPLADDSSQSAPASVKEPAGALTGKGAPSWDAPPGDVEPLTKQTARGQKPPSRVEAAQAREDFPDWEAPPSQVIPGSRRRAMERALEEEEDDDGQATAIARTPSSGNLPRSNSRADLPRRNSEPALPRRRSETEIPRRNSEPDVPRRTGMTRVAPSDPPEPQRRRRSASATQIPRPPSRTQLPRRRTGTGTELALDRERDARDEDDAYAREQEEEARQLARSRDPEPPRRRTGERPRPSSPALEVRKPQAPPVDPEVLAAQRARAKARWKALLTFLLVGAVLLALVLFRKPLMAWLSEAASTRTQGIYISVTSNLPVTVSVLHKEPNATEPLTVLGEQPLRRVSGVHIGDVVVLDNRKNGAHYEEPIPFGQPGETRVINKEFRLGRVRWHFTPKSVSGLQLWMNDNQIAVYPGPMPELTEGKHHIEVRGPNLKGTVSFEVDVTANEVVDMKPLDLKAFLD